MKTATQDFDCSQIIYQEYDLLDIDEIVKLGLGCFVQPFDPQLVVSVQNQIGAFILVATVQEKIIGFSICSRENSKVVHLQALCVCESYRGKGIGKKLLELTIIQVQKDYNLLILEVSVNNAVALNLYKTRGFQIKQFLQEYYQNADDAYLLALSLNPDKGG